MSTYQQTELRCDHFGPSNPYDCDSIIWDNSVRQARYAARKAGWVHVTRNGRKVDLCPNHKSGTEEQAGDAHG